MNARLATRLGALAVTAGLVVPVVASLAGPALAATPAPTRTVLSTAKPSVPVGAVVKLKATVKPVTGTGQPAGSVTYKEGATTLGSATLAAVNGVQTATLSISTLPIGPHTLTATYAGSATFATSTSLALTLTITKPATSTTLTTSTPTVITGKAATVKAVVKALTGGFVPTGSVTFTEGATTLGTVALAPVSGKQTAKLTVNGLALGNHAIVATYAGNTQLSGSTSKVITVAVVKATTTTVVLAVAETNPGDYKLNVTVAKVLPATGAPTGLVTYIVDGQAPQLVNLLAFGKATLAVTLAVGVSHTVEVSYAGDAVSLPSQTTLTFVG